MKKIIRILPIVFACLSFAAHAVDPELPADCAYLLKIVSKTGTQMNHGNLAEIIAINPANLIGEDPNLVVGQRVEIKCIFTMAWFDVGQYVATQILTPSEIPGFSSKVQVFSSATNRATVNRNEVASAPSRPCYAGGFQIVPSQQ